MDKEAELDSLSWNIQVVPIPYVSGDVNAGGSVASAEIIRLVSLIFEGGPPPYPWEASGDVTCGAVLTSADIVRLVNCVFKSAAVPVCP